MQPSDENGTSYPLLYLASFGAFYLRQSRALFFLLLCAFTGRAQNFISGQAARASIGQFEFTYGAATPGQQIVGGVSGLAYANGLLFVADSNRISATPQDNRVLMFNVSQIPGSHADLTTATPFDTFCNLCGYPATNVLGQPDYVTTNPGRSSQGMETPTAVATDGNILAVADTDNNRVLIWSAIPTSINQPANIVLGQANFSTGGTSVVPTASSLRGPQGVWIQNGKLFVADTQDYRVLIWNSIPTTNNQPASLVLGQPDFFHANAPPPTKTFPPTAANQLLNPVAVSSDGVHLFVADLGFNRVLIWNGIPTTMDQNADVVVGQPDMTTAVPNWSNALCASNGTDSNGNPTYPFECGATLNFPRFALSDGTRLFIADGGNDRVLIFNSIPMTNGATADEVLGQPDFFTDIITNQGASIVSTTIDNTGAVDTLPTPTSLAFDGTNLYVSDPYNRRVEVFTPGDTPLGTNSVLNWASEIIRQEGVVTLAGTITANDTVTITIQGTNYTYTVKTGDTLDGIAQALVSLINANGGDPNATAIFAGAGTASVYLSSKGVNLPFDAISLSANTSNTADITATASGAYLSSGTGATAAPGMLVEIDGTNLSDQPSGTPVVATLSGVLPTTLGGAQVYMDGFASPVLSASATQVVAQVPYSFTDRNSTSVYVRTLHNDGSVTVTNATPVYIASANPGLFNAPSFAGQQPPRPAAGALHQAGNPQAVVSIDGTVKAGDTATITVGNTPYTYTVVSTDTLATIAQNLANLINNAPDPFVTASLGGAFTRVVLTARQGGQAGTGIGIAGSTSANAQVTVTAYTTSTCCAVMPASAITTSNPAVPGELITVNADGIGIVTDPSGASTSNLVTGYPYLGPEPNSATNPVNATINGQTAQVVSAGLPQGSYGVYQVQLIVPPGLPNNPATQLFIAQNAFVSNIVTLPVGVAPAASVSAANVTFANQNSGVTSTGQTVTVTNSGTGPLSVSAISITGANAADFAEGDNCVPSVAAGATCSISVTFTPSATGPESATLNVNGTGISSPLVVALSGNGALQFVPVTPCRVADTRNGNGAFGGPFISGQSERDFAIPNSACGIPATAQAYSLNVTAVPHGPLGYLTVWQSGQSQPFVSTLNSADGRVKANAAIVPAGSNGAISVFASNDTDVVLDIDGYFVPAGGNSALAFYPMTPCRIADTRNATGSLGGPSMSAGQDRTFPVLSSSCGVPSNAQAYSLNFTAVPTATLGYLTTWPTGQAQPLVSTLNAQTGTVTANAAIVPAGQGGSIDVFVTNQTDVVIDINGYFAPPGTGGLSLYNLQPCRVLDTRNQGSQPFSGTLHVNVAASTCGVSTAGQAYVFNATVVPPGPLEFLTLWPDGQAQPLVSTLNAQDGFVTSNMAIVPTTNGSIDAFPSNPTHLVVDIFGFFAP